MRDTGLDEAIRAAGGVGALARKIGISQPSVSNWSRIPAERVLAVEAATGVDRSVLRPDLYSERHPNGGDLDEVDAARAQEYTLLAALLSRAPDQALLDRLATLRGDASPLGVAHAALAEAASRTDGRARRARVLQSLHRARARGTAALRLVLSIRIPARAPAGAAARAALRGSASSAPTAKSEPEDHAAILCEIMAGLINGRLPAEPGADRELFEKHLSPWIGRFFADLEQAEAADFYRNVGTLGRLFVDMETEAFALPS